MGADDRRNWEQIGNNFGNKLGTEHPRTPWKTVEQGEAKSMRGKDGRLFKSAHNPKVALACRRNSNKAELNVICRKCAGGIRIEASSDVNHRIPSLAFRRSTHAVLRQGWS